MKLYQATCRFCSLPLTVEIDESYKELGSILGGIPELVKMAACNRCADHETKKRKIRDAMERNARVLMLEIHAGKGMSDTAKLARSNMNAILEKWFGCICDHHLIETQSDEVIKNMVTDKPDRWANAFYHYEKCIKKLAHSLRQPQEAAA